MELKSYNTAKLSLGIIGCGTMARGLIKLCIKEGIVPKILVRNEEKIPMLEKELFEYQRLKFPTRLLIGLKFTMNIEQLAGCNLIIESIVEDFNQKAVLYKLIKRKVNKNTAIGTTTSSLSINNLAKESGLEDRLIGLHFFNPPQAIPFIEVIKSNSFRSDLLEIIINFIRLIKYDYIFVPDIPGFVVNKLLFTQLLTAVELTIIEKIEEKNIDKSVEKSLGHPMGPFTLLKLIGFDTADKIFKNIFKENKKISLWKKYYQQKNSNQ